MVNSIKDKLSPLFSISASSLKKDVLLLPNDFDQAKKLLKSKKIDFIPFRFANCLYLKNQNVDINSLASLNEVQYITPNTSVQALHSDLRCINLESLIEQKFYGKGKTICFIDTGISPHPDFVFPTSRIIKFIDLVNGRSSPYDDNGHGTFVAGIACGGGIVDQSKISPASKSNIIMIKALDNLGLATTETILKAMEWIYQNHKVYNIDVVCMSLGANCEDIDPLSNGASALWKKGLVVLAAAGNSGPKNTTIKSPGICPDIITVGGIDQTILQTADFSSRGPTIFGHKPDLIAPAVNLTSCGIKNELYSTMSGTSVATPIVAGICAVALEKYHLTNNELKHYLKQHCTPITHNPDEEGSGYINFSPLHII